MALVRYDGSFYMTVHGLNVEIRFTVQPAEETDGPGVRDTFEEWEAVNRVGGESFGEWFYEELRDSGEIETVEKAIQKYIDDCPHDD